jgi:inosine-uridine nucleoside N-ribohydrolase
MDDALAILLALKSPEVEVRGLTIVAGNSGAAQCAINARKILHAAGRRDVPVAIGAEKPLLRAAGAGWHGHGPDGLGGFGDLPESETPFDPRGAVRFLAETLEASAEPVTLVPIAPLTNIALLLAAEPAVKPKIREIVLMGGAVFCPGNSSPAAEFNIWYDPEAARMVFAAGVPITVVGLDVTNRTVLRPAQVDRIAASSAQGAAFAARVANQVMPHAMARWGEPRMALHDPLAVGAVVDRALVETKHLYVDVSTEGITAGQTLADPRGLTGKPPNAHVCLEVDAERFVELFTARLCGE